MHEIQQIDAEKYLMASAPRPSVLMAKGSGSWLWDTHDNRYLDFLQGWAVNTLGHCPVEIQQVLETQGRQLLTPSPAFHNKPQLQLAQLLCETTGAHQATFSVTGAEANEVAVKLARKWGQINRRGAFTILTATNSFHGRTLAMMAATGKSGFSQIFPPSVSGFHHVPYGDTSALTASIDDSTVAVMVEPIQGEAGVVVPPEGYLSELREVCDRYGLLLIADEIQTGCGRTGHFLAQSEDSMIADITTLGKGLGAGVPVSATLCSARAASFDPGDQGGTHCGNPLAMAVAHRVVQCVVAPGFLSTVREMGRALEEELIYLSAKTEGTVRGRGLMRALQLREPIAPAWTHRAREQERLLVNSPRETVLRLVPSLRVSASEIADGARRLAASYPKAS